MIICNDTWTLAGTYFSPTGAGERHVEWELCRPICRGFRWACRWLVGGSYFSIGLFIWVPRPPLTWVWEGIFAPFFLSIFIPSGYIQGRCSCVAAVQLASFVTCSAKESFVPAQEKTFRRPPPFINLAAVIQNVFFFLIDFHFHSLKFLLVCIPGFSSSRQKSAANVGDYLIMKLLPEETEKRTWRRANQSHGNDTERTLSRFNGQLRGIAGTGAWKCPHLPVDSMNIQWGNRAPCSRQ